MQVDFRLYIFLNRTTIEMHLLVLRTTDTHPHESIVLRIVALIDIFIKITDSVHMTFIQP